MDCKQRMRDIIEIRLHNLGLRQKDLADSIGVPATLVPHEVKKDADAIRGISDDALKVGCLWDGLDEAGKAIILGDIYRRAEAMTMASDALAGEQLRAAK